MKKKPAEYFGQAEQGRLDRHHRVRVAITVAGMAICLLLVLIISYINYEPIYALVILGDTSSIGTVLYLGLATSPFVLWFLRGVGDLLWRRTTTALGPGEDRRGRS